MTSSAVLPAVSYQNMRCWQQQGVKLLGQCSLCFQHQRGEELGLSSMVNESELLINAVTENKPKMLIGLNQRVSGQAQGFNSPLS